MLEFLFELLLFIVVSSNPVWFTAVLFAMVYCSLDNLFIIYFLPLLFTVVLLGVMFVHYGIVHYGIVHYGIVHCCVSRRDVCSVWYC